MKNTNALTSKEVFYQNILIHLLKHKIPFMLGGTFAFREYTKINRPTKDLDIFCKAGDYPKILELLASKGYKTEITDARWLAKVYEKQSYVDFIFGTANGMCPVDDTWFDTAPTVMFLGHKVKLTPPEEMIWSKAFFQDRTRFDGADVNHLILTCGKTLNWKHLFTRMELHWEILMAHIINFRFVYPSERELIPLWLMEELLSRVKNQFLLPHSKEKICRGQLLDRTQYHIDIHEWGFLGVT